MNTAFIIPCDFSLYHPHNQHYQACRETISTLKYPASGIGIVEYGGSPIEPSIQESLLEDVSFIAAYQHDEKIKAQIQQLPEKQVNTLCQIAALTWFFSLSEAQKIFPQPTQVMVVTPGVQINSDLFSQLSSQQQEDKFIFAPPTKATLRHEDTGGVLMQLSTTLWGFNSQQLPTVTQVLNKALHYTYQRFLQNGDIDLGHALFQFIDSSDIFFINQLPK
ncbi:hypothetical protein [Pelistega ratti]|uniref:hypothetical protein n=1 Tax=Pelistega ratti TaxID=2652177 RepID=UPI00135AC3D7|nr:hypothetical protein [Pelistega ratti]